MVRSWQVALTVFLVLTGMLAVAQWRAELPRRAQIELPSMRTQELAVLLKRQAEARRALEDEVARLRQRLRAFRRAVAEGEGAAGVMAREVAQFRLVLGLTQVTGPGVTVRLQSTGVPGGVVPVEVRAGDLAGLVNELWSAGAEAISVNGARVVATTGFKDEVGRMGLKDQAGSKEFKDGGGHVLVGGRPPILVGGRPMKPPFEVAAIGEPLTLHGALRVRGGFVEGLQSIGLDVRVKRKDTITIPAYRGSLSFRYARPIETPR